MANIADTTECKITETELDLAFRTIMALADMPLWIVTNDQMGGYEIKSVRLDCLDIGRADKITVRFIDDANAHYPSDMLSFYFSKADAAIALKEVLSAEHQRRMDKLDAIIDKSGEAA